MSKRYLGIDFGTTGARAIVIDESANIVCSVQNTYANVAAAQLAQTWQSTLDKLILQIPIEVRKELQAIAINGTSSTVLLCDAQGQSITPPLLYNDSRGESVLEKIKSIAPENHVVISATSSLAKLLWWQQQPYFHQAHYLLHQADWLAFLLHGKLGISDYHNALKLGYDVEQLNYPDWLQKLDCRNLYPRVLTPGTLVDTITPTQSLHFDIPKNCTIHIGTTDSIAAFLASGAAQPGEGVTSLGSTMVLKLLSCTRVTESDSGIYSHRLSNLWLIGGASNTGGAVLKHFFTDQELASLSAQINPVVPSSLEYYPLLKAGDRFPINDPYLSPKLEPRPKDSVEFLHGLLESMARIENFGYQKLLKLSGDNLQCIYTAGGGAKNSAWRKIRQRHLGVSVKVATNTQAAYGTALMASGRLSYLKQSK